MKYKIGDRVRIKSLDWYKKTLSIPSKLSWINKQNNFFEGIRCGSRVFTDAMRKFCGKVMTIQEVGITFYLMEEDKIKYEFTDEMIEGLVNEHAKEHQEKMVSLDEVCDMLYAMLDTHQDSYGYDYVTAPAYDTVEDLVEDFRKSMEK